MEKKVKLNYRSLLGVLTVALVLVVVINFYTLYSIQQLLTEKLKVSEDAAKPVVLDAILITNSKCTDCFDIKQVVTEIEATKGIQLKTKKTLEFDAPEAKETITKYSLAKFPSLVVTGDIARATLLKNKLADLGGTEKEGIILFAEPIPPYTDKNGKVLGHVAATIIKDDSCKECTDLAPLLSQLKAMGVAVVKDVTVSKGSKEGDNAVEKYKIPHLPALVLSSDFSVYEQFAGSWKMYGDIASDGSYVLKEVNPPYKDLATGNVKGLVTITYLSDNSCKECYNVSVHKQILNNFGVFISSEKQYDYASLEGKTMVQKYNVTALPTILLSSEAKDYKALVNVWQRVGTVESDGFMVFRNLGAMTGVTYMDLVKNTIVKGEVAKGDNE